MELAVGWKDPARYLWWSRGSEFRVDIMRSESSRFQLGGVKPVGHFWSKASRWVVLSLGLCVAQAHAAPVQLTDIGFSALPGDRTEVKLTFNETPPEPRGYTIEQPARIALDLSGVSSSLASKYHQLGQGNTQSVTVVDAGGRTRLVVNLQKLVPYQTRVEGNNLFLLVGAQQGAPVAAAVEDDGHTTWEAKPTTAKASSRPTVTDVDFRRGEKGEGRVIIGLSNPNVGVDMSEQAGRIRLEFEGVQLPQDLQRKLDVTDFATPVTGIDVFSEAGNTVVVVKPQGDFDYLAYQADQQFTLSVEPVTKAELERRNQEKFTYTGEKLSLNFQDIEVRSVLQLIADFTGLNLVASDTVGGRITLRLQNVPWDQALELILKTKGLDKRTVGNVMLIAPATEIAAREKLELEASKQVAELAPIRLEVIQINYAKANQIVDLLRADKELISDRGFISSDQRTNTISIRETAEKIAQVRRLVETWDIPVRQVLIEARIVRASSNVGKDLGIRWGGGYFNRDGNKVFTAGGSQNTLSELREVAGGSSNSISFPDALMVDLGVSKTNTSTFAIGFGGDDFLIDLELSALETDGRGEIVAQPKVVTADRQTATIKSGEEIPYQEASSSGATSVSFKEAVLSLEVTPHITPDDNIIMDLRVNQDSRGEVTAGIPSIDTNEVITQVLVPNGETVVLGGIYQTAVSHTISKTPFLGDIPYLGALFRKVERSDERSELLIFITPKLLKDGLVTQ